MKFVERLARRFGYAPTRLRKRAIDAGTVTRLTQSWSGANGSIDRDVYGRLELARNRSRDLSYNNDYMRKFLALCRTNIVGPNGFSLQVRANMPDGTPDKDGNDATENSFYRWSRRGVCEITGKHSFVQLCQLIANSAGRDGEALVRKVYGGNDYNFALQLLDIERLDERKNEQLADGRVIKMGVELSPQGRPLAYHIRKKHPNDIYPYTHRGEEIERVPASEIYHVGVFERPEQTRCLPWAISAMIRLENIGGYEEAAVIAARYGAAKMGYWDPGEAPAESLADDKGTTDEGNEGELFTDLEPGEIRVAPHGAELKTVDWKYPHEQYEMFVKACLRGIASGIGVTYASLSSDLTQTSFSSGRTGVLEERDGWKTLQGWFIESFLEPLYADWLRMAMASDQVKTPRGGVIRGDKFEKFNVPEWRGRRWSWVDPEKDINAAILAIDNGLQSRRAIVSEQGLDLEEVWQDLAQEQVQAAKLGLTFGQKPKGSSDAKGKQDPKAAEGE